MFENGDHVVFSAGSLQPLEDVRDVRLGYPDIEDGPHVILVRDPRQLGGLVFMRRVLPRRAHWIAMAAVVFLLPCSIQAAGYVNDGEAWLAMPPQAKAAYIQGLSDTVNYVYVNDDLDTAIVKVARTRCLLATKSTGVLLSDVITSAYTKNPALKVQPPIVVYVSRMADVCKSIINEERARMSLPPK